MLVTGLFAGIGGLELGFHRAGFQTTDLVEIDPFARSVLARRFPDARLHVDVRDFTLTRGSADVLVGGFPCQDISSANTRGGRHGLNGKKSSLWGEFARNVESGQPDWVVVENVDRGRDWVSTVRRDLAALGYASLPALRMRADRMGYNHGRRRLFVVAHSNGEGEPLRAFHAQMAGVREATGRDRDRRTPASEVVGMANGVPRSMDRLRALGNAVMPEMSERIGLAIRRAVEARP